MTKRQSLTSQEDVTTPISQVGGSGLVGALRALPRGYLGLKSQPGHRASAQETGWIHVRGEGVRVMALESW